MINDAQQHVESDAQVAALRLLFARRLITLFMSQSDCFPDPYYVAQQFLLRHQFSLES